MLFSWIVAHKAALFREMKAVPIVFRFLFSKLSRFVQHFKICMVLVGASEIIYLNSRANLKLFFSIPNTSPSFFSFSQRHYLLSDSGMNLEGLSVFFPAEAQRMC